MATAQDPSLNDLVKLVAYAVQEVDEHVMRSGFIPQEMLPHLIYEGSDLETKLESVEIVGQWEKYFDFLLKEWDEDDDGERLSEAKFNFIIDRLSVSASTLDHYGPQLVRMYRRLPGAPEKRVRGILRRRTTLNGFLNSAEIALEHWYRHAGILKERTLRQRRRLPDAVGVEVQMEAPSTTTQSTHQAADDNKSRGRAVISVLTSNSTLITITALTTIAAAIIQTYSYTLATRSEQPRGGTIDSSEFFSTLQSSLMGLLGQYVTILPALRHRLVRRSYARWSWFIAFLGMSSALVAAAFYVYSPAAAQLALFLGSATQATIVLQLIWAMDEAVDPKMRQEKDK